MQSSNLLGYWSVVHLGLDNDRSVLVQQGVEVLVSNLIVAQLLVLGLIKVLYFSIVFDLLLYSGRAAPFASSQAKHGFSWIISTSLDLSKGI